MLIKVVKKNHKAKEESFFIDNVQDLEIIKMPLSKILTFARTKSPELDSFCNDKRNIPIDIKPITYAEFTEHYNWVLSSLVLKLLEKYEISKYMSIQVDYDLTTFGDKKSIYMSKDDCINILFFKLPSKINPNVLVNGRLSTVYDNVYIINDKGQTVESIKYRGL